MAIVASVAMVVMYCVLGRVNFMLVHTLTFYIILPVHKFLLQILNLFIKKKCIILFLFYNTYILPLQFKYIR